MKEIVVKGRANLEKFGLDPRMADYLYRYVNSDEEFKTGIERYIKGEPIQYILGNVNFYGYHFEVNPNVLIPRFETEELVEKTIIYAKELFPTHLDIVDIGTGSGCIAVTLKLELPGACVDATDISEMALNVAIDNAKRNHVRVKFMHGNLLEPLKKKYDLIISNPPYIAYDEEVMEIVKQNEPHIALYADEDGLYYYHEILKNVSKYLKEKAMIAFEIGDMQASRIEALAYQYIPNCRVEVKKDMQHRYRFLFIFIG